MARALINGSPILSGFLKLKEKDIMKMSPLDALNLLNVAEDLHNIDTNNEFLSWLCKHLSESVSMFKLTGNYYKELKEYESNIANPGTLTSDELDKINKSYNTVKNIFESLNKSSCMSLKILQQNIHMKLKFNVTLI
jgi:hypothetical protein